MTLPERIETERLLLRPFQEMDVPRLVELIGRWEVSRNLAVVPYPYGEADARAWLAHADAARVQGTELSLAAVCRADDRLIGGIGLRLVEGELGYWLGEDYWGQGYATEMARAVVRTGFEALGLREILATTAPGNDASGRVLTKAGLIRRGERLGDVPKFGGRHLAPFYRLTIEEWRARYG